MKPHDLTERTDPDGRKVVGVHLSNRPETAWLYRADYDRITRDFGTPMWRLTHNGKGRAYVRFKEIGNNPRYVTVSRLVAGDFEKTAVRYKDDNPLNLRTPNLYHDDGGGRCPKMSRRHALAASHAMKVSRSCDQNTSTSASVRR